MDVPVAYLLVLNLRDSDVEDNVRKRPFSNKYDPQAHWGPFESRAKIANKTESSKKIHKKNSEAAL